jgi:Tfp pilus assembly protein PilF
MNEFGVKTLFFALFMLCSFPPATQDVKRHAKEAVELGWRYLDKGDAGTALKRFNQALLRCYARRSTLPPRTVMLM